MKARAYSNQDNRQMHIAELDAEQGWYLADNDVESSAGGETVHDRVGQELGDDAEVKDGK